MRPELGSGHGAAAQTAARSATRVASLGFAGSVVRVDGQEIAARFGAGTGLVYAPPGPAAIRPARRIGQVPGNPELVRGALREVDVGADDQLPHGPGHKHLASPDCARAGQARFSDGVAGYREQWAQRDLERGAIEAHEVEDILHWLRTPEQVDVTAAKRLRLGNGARW
jgi:hypothetical protein